MDININVTTTDQSPNSSNNKMYRGVRKRKWGKWVSEIRLPNSRERIWLGSYDTQEKAARAFDAALYCLRGPHASFNFPNTPLTINVAVNHGVGHQSLSPEEIQDVAAKFANESPPIELTHEDDQQVPSEAQNDTISNHSYSCPLNDNDGRVQVDYGDLRRMDWKFEDMFDDLNGVANCSNLYGQENMQYSTQLVEEDNVDQIECEDTFSDHSFLWSWNF
ncbi:putative transcription factor AP2-EREBP family [Medicago truncatula]|uniref:Ethylene-responsive transcription factor ERF018 n=1 Tax=Medicago truncatula TaxID=3880 RepID=A0A072VER1_MEDTR|nr:ethylene-responsive transcription factor ERF018 [Medicago truncatula]KEH39898.1 ethylene-responsive transcription factor ERF018 [Medicago truncatula]RHN77063.1 putative transcription factor AP2-EREBP family [Medicago truncatula]